MAIQIQKICLLELKDGEERQEWNPWNTIIHSMLTVLENVKCTPMCNF